MAEGDNTKAQNGAENQVACGARYVHLVLRFIASSMQKSSLICFFPVIDPLKSYATFDKSEILQAVVENRRPVLCTHGEQTTSWIQ